MSTTTKCCGFACFLVFAVLGNSQNTDAAFVKLTFSGTTGADLSPIGIASNPTTFHFSMVYDTSRNDDGSFVAAGSNIGTGTSWATSTTHDWYGYSRAGIVSFDFEVAGYSFSIGDILGGRKPFSQLDFAPDFWFDTDISVETPSLMWLNLEGEGASLELGGGWADGTTTWLTSSGSFYRRFGPGRNDIVSGTFENIQTSASTAVPEPWTIGLWGMGGLCGFFSSASKRRIRKPSEPI